MLDQEREKLRAIKTFPSLVKYLRDELDWPIETDDFNEIVFDYAAEEQAEENEQTINEITAWLFEGRHKDGHSDNNVNN